MSKKKFDKKQKPFKVFDDKKDKFSENYFETLFNAPVTLERLSNRHKDINKEQALFPASDNLFEQILLLLGEEGIIQEITNSSIKSSFSNDNINTNASNNNNNRNSVGVSTTGTTLTRASSWMEADQYFGLWENEFKTLRPKLEFPLIMSKINLLVQEIDCWKRRDRKSYEAFISKLFGEYKTSLINHFSLYEKIKQTTLHFEVKRWDNLNDKKAKKLRAREFKKLTDLCDELYFEFHKRIFDYLPQDTKRSILEEEKEKSALKKKARFGAGSVGTGNIDVGDNNAGSANEGVKASSFKDEPPEARLEALILKRRKEVTNSFAAKPLWKTGALVNLKFKNFFDLTDYHKEHTTNRFIELAKKTDGSFSPPLSSSKDKNDINDQVLNKSTQLNSKQKSVFLDVFQGKVKRTDAKRHKNLLESLLPKNIPVDAYLRSRLNPWIVGYLKMTDVFSPMSRRGNDNDLQENCWQSLIYQTMQSSCGNQTKEMFSGDGLNFNMDVYEKIGEFIAEHENVVSNSDECIPGFVLGETIVSAEETLLPTHFNFSKEETIAWPRKASKSEHNKSFVCSWYRIVKILIGSDVWAFVINPGLRPEELENWIVQTSPGRDFESNRKNNFFLKNNPTFKDLDYYKEYTPDRTTFLRASCDNFRMLIINSLLAYLFLNDKNTVEKIMK